jgi:hypothetical protein
MSVAKQWQFMMANLATALGVGRLVEAASAAAPPVGLSTSATGTGSAAATGSSASCAGEVV